MGGQRIEGQSGAFMQPTVLTDIEAANPTYKQEFFGPVALFFRVPDEAAAVALANDSPFGLGGSVFTQDLERGKRVARQIDTGMVFINSAAVSMPDLPFGGVKNSGYGRELSGAGIQEFVNKKPFTALAAHRLICVNRHGPARVHTEDKASTFPQVRDPRGAHRKAHPCFQSTENSTAASRATTTTSP
eukprot:gene35904-58922_t